MKRAVQLALGARGLVGQPHGARLGQVDVREERFTIIDEIDFEPAAARLVVDAGWHTTDLVYADGAGVGMVGDTEEVRGGAVVVGGADAGDAAP